MKLPFVRSEVVRDIIYQGTPSSAELRQRYAFVKNLRPFTPDATCPKCAGDGGMCVTSTWEQEAVDFDEGPETYEWMLRQCTGCKYRWREKPADAT